MAMMRIKMMMMVRCKFVRLKPALKAATVEPIARPLRRSLHEIVRRREIIRRHIKRANRWHKANVDVIPKLLKLADDLPGDQQGDPMQGPGD